MAAIASGTMIDAPYEVIVPETLMIGRRPRRSRMVELMRSVMYLSSLGFGGVAEGSGANFDDRLNLDADIAGQGADPDRRAGMRAALAEHFRKEVRAAVDHLRMVAKGRDRVDEAEQLDDP